MFVYSSCFKACCKSKIEIGSRLHCIYIYDDDCMLDKPVESVGQDSEQYPQFSFRSNTVKLNLLTNGLIDQWVDRSMD